MYNIYMYIFKNGLYQAWTSSVDFDFIGLLLHGFLDLQQVGQTLEIRNAAFTLPVTISWQKKEINRSLKMIH